MYQQFGNTTPKKERVWTFVGLSSSAGGILPAPNFPFHIPRTINYVKITCIQAGAGGGGGGVAAASTAAAGGGGGASGCVTSLTINANYLPSTIWCSPATSSPPGTGQVQGGAAATAGSNGFHSYVTICPQSTTGSEIIITSGTSNANGGGAASANTAGIAGTAGTASTATSANLMNAGVWTSLAGMAGTIGGTGTTPSSGGTAQWGSSPGNPFCSGGAGGGGVNAGTTVAAGGTCNGLPTQSKTGSSLTFTPASSAGTNGIDGLGWGQVFWLPYTSMGGTGGTGNTSAGTGGQGGGGGVGSGGGGGGASNGTSSHGGAGGTGGPGAIIIVCW